MPLYGTIWVLLIVFTIARLSYGTRMTNSGLIQIHPELEESALMSGGSAWEAFRRISVPLLTPTLLYAWLWIALLIFRELTLAVILSSADNVTFPVVVWSLWLGGGLGQASALAVVMLVMMTPMIAIYWILRPPAGAGGELNVADASTPCSPHGAIRALRPSSTGYGGMRGTLSRITLAPSGLHADQRKADVHVRW